MYFQTGIENEQIVQALASLPSFCIKKMETFKGFMCLEKSMYKKSWMYVMYMFCIYYV